MSESIFGRHMTNADGGIVRQFYNGVTRREEAWLDRNVEGREHASWTVYHTWDIRDNGQLTDANKFHDHDAALADYNRRVSELQAANCPEMPDSSTSESESPMGSAEILNGLRAMLSNVSTEADDFDEHASMDRGVLRAAIAALTPEPITPEGLEAWGCTGDEICLLSGGIHHGTLLYDRAKKEVFFETRQHEEIPLPGIRTMADVDAMIRFLEGTNAE